MINSFIRLADGTFTTFFAQGAASTFAESINDGGSVCGNVFSAHNVKSGFLRNAAGNFILYSGPQPNSGGDCVDLKNNLRATGTYIDSSSAWHAWVK